MDFTIAFFGLFFWSMYLVAPLLVFLTFIVIVFGQIVCYIEQWGKFDGLYWSLITATTVGYGDIRPVKKISKVFSVIIAVIGMMITGIIIAVTITTASIALDKYGDDGIIEIMKERFE
ncbi:MAG: ion channel [Gammaproteobacteria bacterium]